MHKDPYTEDTDAFFSMRKRFWMESRKRALAQKKRGESQEFEEACGPDHDSPVLVSAVSGK